MAEAWSQLGHEMAAELDRVREGMEDLAVRLCLDPIVVERHAAPLQAFDALGQVIGEIVGLLRSEGTAGEAVGAIRLEALRVRLSQHAAD